MDYQHLANDVHKIAVILDNRGPSGARIYTQKPPSSRRKKIVMIQSNLFVNTLWTY